MVMRVFLEVMKVSRKKIRMVVDKVHFDADKGKVVGMKGHVEYESDDVLS